MARHGREMEERCLDAPGCKGLKEQCWQATCIQRNLEMVAQVYGVPGIAVEKRSLQMVVTRNNSCNE